MSLYHVLVVIVQVTKLCLTLCNPMDCSMDSYQSITISWSLRKFMSIELVMLCQSDGISNCYAITIAIVMAISSSAAPFSFCFQSFPASGFFPVCQLFATGGKIVEHQLQHQSFQWILRVDFLQDWLVWSPCSPTDSQESSPGLQFKSISSSAFSLLYGPTLNGNSLQYFCLKNLMDRGAWWATVHRAAKSQTQLKQFSMNACSHPYMTTGKTIALRIQNFVRKVMSFIF